MTLLFDIPKMYEKYNIPKKGIIHVGAWEGEELETYHRMGIPKVLYIEANPKVYTRLVDSIRKKSLENIVVFSFCCAISNKMGMCRFHVMSADQSSSLLPLKIHKEIYPDIKEESCIDIQCYTLDGLLEYMKIEPSDFNFINIDIQGAELLAFQGATNLLTNSVIAINTEVNFQELYEKCVLEPKLTEYLQGFGFERKGIKTPFHSSWGDAFYVKEGNV